MDKNANMSNENLIAWPVEKKKIKSYKIHLNIRFCVKKKKKKLQKVLKKSNKLRKKIVKKYSGSYYWNSYLVQKKRKGKKKKKNHSPNVRTRISFLESERNPIGKTKLPN